MKYGILTRGISVEFSFQTSYLELALKKSHVHLEHSDRAEKSNCSYS